MESPIVVVTDPIHQAGLDALDRTASVIRLYEFDEDSRFGQLEKAEAIIMRGFQATADIMKACPQLKLITKHGSGVDNIDIPNATALGICVANTPGGNNASAVAEGAVTLMLAVQRRILDIDSWTRNNQFSRRAKEPLHDLWEGTLGLVGTGHIARVVAQICGKGFSMKIKGFDPYVSAESMQADGIEKVSDLHELMASVDVVSIHTPLTSETKHLIRGEHLSKMKPDAILVNTSRGSVVDEKALIDALSSKTIRAAGIDVFEQEPPDPDNPLFSLNNVVVSPHIAGITQNSLKGMALSCAEVIDQFFSGSKPETILNGGMWQQRRQ
jgi:D-3-phosphoglycerate dehydrogenase